ncbi:hypothetical protein M23134_07213 [Microscilla marina ATCC 23134]|uniref:Uncharacterized protein n=1 Tax=Microscilla marina ATCC 23134 TaxID=313606 RepID=A1ZX43_MICM2|nr:hypothetical protein M23134_07213 [Microscilla marina ATCC 23134]
MTANGFSYLVLWQLPNQQKQANCLFCCCCVWATLWIFTCGAQVYDVLFSTLLL